MFKKIFRNKTLVNIGSYSGFNLINSAIPFLLLPVLTQNLSKSDFAIIDIFTNLTFILAPLIGLNIGSSIIRFYYDKELYNLKTFFSSSLIFIIISGIVIILLTLTFNIFFADLLNINKTIQGILLLSIFYALSNQIGETLLSLYRASERPIPYGKYRVIKTFFDFSISTFLIVFVWSSWTMRVYTAVAISCIFSIVSIILLIKELELRFDYHPQYVKSALTYSVPLILHDIGGHIINYADRLIILHFTNLDSVGIYAVAYQIGLVMSLVGNSINQAWTPFLFSILKEQNPERIRWLDRFHIKMIFFYFLLAGIIYLFTPFIYSSFIGKAFNASPHIVLIILASYAINASYKNYVNYLFYYKKTARLSVYTGLGALINIGLCWYWIPKYNILGAAYATLISFSIQFILVFIDYQRNKNLL